MSDTIQVTEELRSEVLHLRHRVTELEAQVIQAEQGMVALPRLEEPFAALFRASPVALVITAFADGRYVDVNEYFARLTGYEREEVLGRTSLELGLWHDPEDRDRMGRMLLEQTVIRDIELTFRTKRQELRTVIASLALIDYAGNPCVLTMCHDITERRLAAIERERLLQEAQAAIRIRDDFLSVAAHELKTPLTALQLHIESLQRVARKDHRTADPTIKRIVSKLEAANQQIDRLDHLINELLDVTQLQQGKLPFHMEVFDLGQVVKTVVDRFEEQCLQENCRVTLEVAPSQMIEADQSSLDHIMTNLLTNAIKYGRGQPIDVCVTGDATSVWLIVRDHGIGIAAADQQRIFERFERAVSNDHYGGLGLGLYVVQQLVRALHGTIQVESEPGRGATFKVCFPRHGLSSRTPSVAVPVTIVGHSVHTKGGTTMAQLTPYLTFDGNCRDAMTFYQSCFGGELTLLPVGDSQMAEQTPPDMRDHLMHSALQTDTFTLMASDSFRPDGLVRGNDVYLCLICSSKDEIETRFAQLSEGGQVGHPLSEEFFGTFGDLTDKFGTRWMLQFSSEPQA